MMSPFKFGEMAPPPPSPSASPALLTTAQAPPATFTSPASGKDAASSPSPLSPDAEPFFPGARSAGRGKSQRWEMDSYDSDTDFDCSSPEAASYLDVARRGCEAVSTGRAGAQPDSQGPGETAAEASHCAPTKMQSCCRRRARAATRRGTGRATATQRVPATQRIGPQAAERVPAHRRLGPQRRATPPDANGWQKVLPRDEGRPPPRASQRQSQSQPGHRIPPEFAGRCLNCLSYSHRVATCRLPHRCVRCHSLHHLAKDCKRPRDHAGGGDRPAGRRFVRAHRDGSTTPRGQLRGARRHLSSRCHSPTDPPRSLHPSSSTGHHLATRPLGRGRPSASSSATWPRTPRRRRCT